MFYFTSDLHINHVNILKPEYCDRPFENVNHMNKMLIENYNNVVKPGDTCFNLGDWFMGEKAKIPEFIEQFKVKPILILGNHDQGKPKEYIRKSGVIIFDSLTIDHDGYKILLEHIPRYDLIECSEIGPNGIFKYQLCGHVH